MRGYQKKIYIFIHIAKEQNNLQSLLLFVTSTLSATIFVEKFRKRVDQRTKDKNGV